MCFITAGFVPRISLPNPRKRRRVGSSSYGYRSSFSSSAHVLYFVRQQPCPIVSENCTASIRASRAHEHIDIYLGT